MRASPIHLKSLVDITALMREAVKKHHPWIPRDLQLQNAESRRVVTQLDI